MSTLVISTADTRALRVRSAWGSLLLVGCLAFLPGCGGSDAPDCYASESDGRTPAQAQPERVISIPLPCRKESLKISDSGTFFEGHLERIKKFPPSPRAS